MEPKPPPNQHSSCPSPSPNLTSSSLLRDISNFKTPKHSSQTPNFHTPHSKFFSANKNTPYSSSFSHRHHRPTTTAARSKSKAARKLKAFELEQSKSARKTQIDKENSLKSLANSLTVWLNFLFENPSSCGVDISKFNGENERSKATDCVSVNGKRDSWPETGVGVDRLWRDPKRQKNLSWKGVEDTETVSFAGSKFMGLKSSLKEVCSFDDLTERLGFYLSLSNCKEIFDLMTQVTKNIDEGRLKMKAHCPIVTDVGLKEKATRILMCYNPIWLRIGLYIIFGGDSLLPNGDVNSEQEIAFLKMVIEKQFFSHPGLAKVYAYNKLVEGLYRPGYYEKLGNVILKRFLLLVLILDRAKSHSSLPIKYGIDGLDGGSPLLFTLKSNIKSSRQVINDFLSSDTMYGEGNLLAHLVIIGYKVSYQQSSLIVYDFKVTNLFDDLRDGVRLCRSIQLLQHDSSILMKMVVPSDTSKKNTVNCCTVLQHLKQAGVPICDEDGEVIVGEDVVNGDKELTVSLLWNMFVHLQLPLLVSKTLLLEEISKICGAVEEQSNTCTHLDMLLSWIQAICESYNLKIHNFASLVDGKAMWCLLDYYFRKEHRYSCSSNDLKETIGQASIMSATDYTDAVHNFILSQKLTSLLGNFPEVLQVSDILENNGACNDRSVVVLLVFLSYQLIVRRNTDQLNLHKLSGSYYRIPERKHLSTELRFEQSETVPNREIQGNNTGDVVRNFKAIVAWWQDMAQRNNQCDLKLPIRSLQGFSTCRWSTEIQRENAAKTIQSHFRRSREHHNYLWLKNSVSFLQIVIRAWLMVKKKSAVYRFSTFEVQLLPFDIHHSSVNHAKKSETFGRYMAFMVDRHNFVTLRRSIIIIQHATRAWISLRRKKAATIIQKCFRGWRARSIYCHRLSQLVKALDVCTENEVHHLQMEAVSRIQHAWKIFVVRSSVCNQHSAATKIQASYRGWLSRKRVLSRKHAIKKIQSIFRCNRCRSDFLQYKTATRSAIIIQSHVRGWIARKGVYSYRCHIIKVQSHCRGWLIRRELLFQREAVVRIQSAFRSIKCLKAFHSSRHAAIEIQRFVRGLVTRKRLLGASKLHDAVATGYISGTARDCVESPELKIFHHSVLKLQRWWRGVLFLNSRTTSAIIIQSHIRGWITRRYATRARHRIVVIQSYWKGYLARKDSRGQLLDLCLRVQKSATNVDDGMRIINRLITALSELLSMKSVSGILHTCATLDMVTEHSQKCCEELVAAGAVDTLLKLIRSCSRSIPDQEVLKHALSTLRNLARYPHLTEVLIDSCGSVEIILWEFLRNKGEAYFIASELLKKICSNQNGVKVVLNLPAHLKRLHNLVADLKRKTGNEKRNARGLVTGEYTERRLGEATELLKLISTNC